MNRSFKLVLGLLASCAIVIFSWPELPTFAHEGETSSASSASSIDKVAEAYGDARVLRNSFLRGIDLHHFLVPRQAEISCLLKKNANSCGVRFPSDPCGLTAL